MTQRAVLVTVVLLLVVIGLLPLLVMFSGSVFVDGRLSLEPYKNLLNSTHQWNLLAHSLVLSTLTAFLCTLIGMPLGILFAKTDMPCRRIFTLLFTVPLLIPPYIMAVSWFNVLGRQGFLARFISPTVAQTTSDLLFGLPGCVLVLFSTFLPVVMLLTMTFLKTINPRLEEAGKTVSAWPGVIKGITIPMILPGVVLGSLLVFLMTLAEFGVPNFLRYNVFPVETFTQFAAFYDFGAATAAALPLVIITLLVLLIERIFLREKTYRVQLPSPGRGSIVIGLGKIKIWCVIIVSVLCFLLVVLPLLILLMQSWSFDAYRLALTRAGDSLLRSLTYAAIGATALSILGFFCGYLIHNRSLPIWRTVDSLTIILLALPSTVIGIGLIFLWNRPATNFIYATPVIIILGYLAQYSALTSRITVSTLMQIPPSMDQAAQMASARWFRRIALIVVPLARRGLIAGWLVGYIFCLRDMGISMMVYPPGSDTFPVRTFTLMANGAPELIAALCIIMIAATLLPLSLLIPALKSRRMTL
ncbi:MAG: iron ABC transporter permease [Planctomycetes bacterium]|nr:iron ABC transporter permease [Planctomycetota bacterium]